jgi:REP element-mobilizing transposase RayT
MIPLKPNEMYHIYNHANGNDNLFRNEENYAYFLKRYAYFIHPIAKTYAYCLMPNHFHLLVKIRSEEGIAITFPKIRTLEKLEILEKLEFDKFISKQFANLFSSYTQSYNIVFRRKGSLFIKNFQRKPVKSEAYFTSLVQYIHRNPLHHGFCDKIIKKR